ncbi:39S ribosomal protein L33, mitochondrial [Coemansia sp. BCRC 34301]|nr:39S ribosomal protein L33, mitochondrial [Coemansia sp. BCRC 34301]
MVGGFTRSISSFTYRTFFKKESTYFTAIVAAGVGFSIVFNTAFDKYWSNKTAGTKWEDIKGRYMQETIVVRLISAAGTGFTYVKQRPRTAAYRLTMMKFDPIVNRHVLFVENKIK